MLTMTFGKKKLLNIYSSSVVTDGYGITYGGSLGGNAQGSYESAPITGYGEAFLGGNGGANNEYYSSSYGGLDQQGLSAVSFTNGGGYNSSNFEQQLSSLTTNYSTDAGGLYQDPNPQVIRRPALGGGQIYTQRVLVKFLQPPPLPPPGVSIPDSDYL